MRVGMWLGLGLLVLCSSSALLAQDASSRSDTLIPVWQNRDNSFLTLPADLTPTADSSAPVAHGQQQSLAVSKQPSVSAPEVHPPRHVPDTFEATQMCDEGTLQGKACRFHWGPALLEQAEYLTIEQTWNLSTNYWVRYYTFNGRWWHDYVESVQGFKFSRWNDANPIIDDYVGHPMMGAITMDIFIQNDPRGRAIEFENTKRYWHSRLWALLWSTVYSTQWKLGPISEASIGNTGRQDLYDPDAHKITNGTGTVGLVVTPLGGWVWALGEDFMDMHVIRHVEKHTNNPVYLTGLEFLNPCRGFANLLRFKRPWYRDSRPTPGEAVYTTQSDAVYNP